jgi:hypothetical protein
MAEFFPDEKIVEMRHKEISMFFKPTQPVKLLNRDDHSEVFRVEGVVTTRSDSNSPGEVLSQKPVAARIGLLNSSNSKWVVYSVIEVGTKSSGAAAPRSQTETQGAAPKNDDGVAKAVGDVAAKKILGF